MYPAVRISSYPQWWLVLRTQFPSFSFHDQVVAVPYSRQGPPQMGLSENVGYIPNEIAI